MTGQVLGVYALLMVHRDQKQRNPAHETRYATVCHLVPTTKRWREQQHMHKSSAVHISGKCQFLKTAHPQPVIIFSDLLMNER